MKKLRSLMSPCRQIAAFSCFLALVPTTLPASDHSDWLNKMQPVTPRTYVCRRAASPIVIDGKLDDAAWADVPWNEDSGDIEGAAKPKPRFRTHVKLLWDDNYLYIGAEMEEPHVWATLTNHDSVIFQDPDFEVFIDPKGETQPYYEFEMNALNTTWDLLLDKPYMDGGRPHNEWEITGAKTAVHVNGTLNDPSDTDTGWTVELAFPWSALDEHARHPGPPTEGEQWRIDFSRVEWQIAITNGREQKIPHHSEDNWVWSPQGVVDMHRPEMWGQLQFTSRPASEPVAVTPIPGKPARDLALEVYYAQRDYFNGHRRWATNLTALHISTDHLPAGVQAPDLESTPEGYTCAAAYDDGGHQHVWRIRQDRLLKLDEALPLESELFLKQAAQKYGDAGRRAAYFLLDNMPAEDRARLSSDFLMENLSLAFQARQRFPWAKAVPERIFFNDVLPYASVDEARELWRPGFYAMAGEIVAGCKTATEAAQALNRDLFNRIKVHYNTHRRRNNQAPQDSIDQGMATCTGLSIILVDACRAVGVPARMAGVPRWADKDGNHTWVEIWDGDWFFTGADEYSKDGLNRAWFNNDAAKTARSENPINQVYATSWRRTGTHFPLAWDPDSREVAGINVSSRYAALIGDTNTMAKLVHVRLFDKLGGERMPAQVEMLSESGAPIAADHTRAGTADLNDMPDFTLPAEAKGVIFRFTIDGKTREDVIQCASCAASHTLDFAWNDMKAVAPGVIAAETWLNHSAAERGSVPDATFSRQDAGRVVSEAWERIVKEQSKSAAAELAAKRITIDGQSMKWMERDFGDAPDGKHTLWITLHGGGQGTEAENDANWKGYYGRYEFPPGSINIAPRAPANTWDMWHVRWMDGLMDRLIADMVINRGVDPNRVYLIGYSAGGDGVYQLAPRMADRFAAATMCAGHPNQVTPEGLRNLPFLLYMGGEDAAYNRNVIVGQFSAKMDVLQKADPEGYTHRLTVYPGLSHNMQGREAEAIPRMVAWRRAAWPKRVVWKENDGFTHNRFYWLERSPQGANADVVYAAHVDGQTITIEEPSSGSLTLRLADGLVNLDQPVTVQAGGRAIFEGSVPRSLAAIEQSLRERPDPDSAATALLPVSW
ncbi:MAG TPA: sugar-binding protein [Verrucomicrobiae bacterium]|jgi:predicted esterase